MHVHNGHSFEIILAVSQSHFLTNKNCDLDNRTQ